MKNLKECLQSAMGGSATPANTTGMGNPSTGSGDVPVGTIGYKFKKKRKKAKKQETEKPKED